MDETKIINVSEPRDGKIISRRYEYLGKVRVITYQSGDLFYDKLQMVELNRIKFRNTSKY